MDQQQILIRCRRQSQLDDPRPVGDVPIVPAGDFTTFAYDIIAEIQDTGTGFDALRVLTTATSAGNLVSSARGEPSGLHPQRGWDQRPGRAELQSFAIGEARRRRGRDLYLAGRRVRTVLDAESANGAYAVA